MLYKSVEFKADAIDADARTFEGYAATWDLDQGGDIITKGAFTKTLNERANRVKVLWQHKEPLGVPVSMSEDDFGLKVKGRISKTRLGDEAIELMRDGVVDQMSIGYVIPEGKSGYNSEGIRVIREIKLLEFSPVTFPMNDAAVITGVKSVRQALLEGKGLTTNEIKELAEMVSELNALLTGSEPPKGTQNPGQPHDLAALKSAIENWGI